MGSLSRTKLQICVDILRFLFRLPLMLLAIVLVTSLVFLIVMTVVRAVMFIYSRFLSQPW